MKLHELQVEKRAFIERSNKRARDAKQHRENFQAGEMSVGRFRHCQHQLRAAQLADERTTGFTFSHDVNSF